MEEDGRMEEDGGKNKKLLNKNPINKYGKDI